MIATLRGRSRWANIFTGTFLGVYLLLLAPLIARLPNTALSAILIMVGIGMFNIERIKVVAMTGRATLAIMTLTFAGAAEVENLLPEDDSARRAVEILHLRVYDEIGSTFKGVIHRYAQALIANDGRLILTGIGSRMEKQKHGVTSSR